MTTLWAYLPNAQLIDRIIADLKAHPERWYATRDATQVAAWDAASALIAWDDVGCLLDLTPDALRMLVHTDTTHYKHAAVLLLPAVIALRDKTEELT